MKKKRISISQLHEKTLPEKKKKAVKIDVVSYYLWRPICDFLSTILINTRISATSITIFSFWMAVLALTIFIIFPGMYGALLGWIFIFVWNISDGIDGNIARYKETFSKKGDLWDATAGYMAMVSFYLGSGIIASSENSMFIANALSSKDYILLGALAALSTIFPRLIVQKKNVVFGNEAVKSLKGKEEYSFIKKIVMNINSINGLAGILLLIAIICKVTNIFVIFYSIFQVIFACGSMIIVMKDLKE